ncbi:hypothetical protein ACQZV8_07020 [Magnetococcales bacterium HHB-1]
MTSYDGDGFSKLDKNHPPITIPLERLDLTEADLLQVQRAVDEYKNNDILIEKIEAIFSKNWQRPARIFSTPENLLGTLLHCAGDDFFKSKRVFVPANIAPWWLEAFETLGLSYDFLDIDPKNGLLCKDSLEKINDTPLFFNHREPDISNRHGMIQEISSTITPIARDIELKRDFQLLSFEGSPLMRGTGALLLSPHEEIITKIDTMEIAKPSAPLLALILSQLETLKMRKQQLHHLAARYLGFLKESRYFALPKKVDTGFMLYFHRQEMRDHCREYLWRAGIGAGMPSPFARRKNRQADQTTQLPGWERFLKQQLAIPFYASLTERTQKRIINRILRWERHQDRFK